ncbi:RHS repeat-associated core domain-containing protein [Aquiflexum gelatinilyticum]|uniref:RHS repeat-associated core domain-containing protein n=1 Tax=Aquiflexum gelatinilyticum TaxID=2961943 RepID=A0A9X2SZX9_9BACT|nr:RHS repeat-associated core domain-containing protein [Aquiflexum gelatinilyticum]MCR9017282.1 RHS repeat-associated core domain-containing protein [Aquiflexum gelatinilyticum]
MRTFLVNETSENVWFDQFRIETTTPVILQETHYDPWGVELQGLGYQQAGIKANKYLYNGKEFNDHLGINLSDYGARMYDASIGRWFVVDALADEPEQVDKSPYAYAWNNPINITDPDGNCPWCLGGIIGAAVEYGSQVGANIYESGFSADAFTKNIDIVDIGVAALEGAATGGFSAVRRTAAKATLTVSAEIVKNAVDVKTDGEGGVSKKVNSVEKTAIDTVIGLTLNAAGGSGILKNGEILKETTAAEAVKAARQSGQVVTREGRQALETQANATLANVRAVNSQTQTAVARTATGGVSERLKDTHNRQY